MSSASPRYLHHAVACEPRTFAAVASELADLDWTDRGGSLYGVWRSQIGRPRDELNVVTVWPDGTEPEAATRLLHRTPRVREVRSEPMRATLRPASAEPPRRQGNYAFRWFELAEAHWDEFVALCAAAWPGFESAYDSQVIGLWRSTVAEPGRVRSLLLTRRPDLAMWERSKIPAGEEEGEVRRLLSRRYDLCDATWVYTTTLLTAGDTDDDVRWT